MKTTSKHLLPRVGSCLVLGGFLVTLFGFALSGFSPERYMYHERNWYDVVDFYTE
ncbi:hypothetical protein NRIC_28060 [Enterococcus florum]|uniref:Uncharacterized protein n=1 Tax=Enterococcus florum TaxID=2480627 RepID=A0A4P5P9Y4_9ENTE|nr:hypothetical protein [Enterococcus florum]GCF94915.1 hypothetical protein NRIC_28060 [Enterococcus florum]